MLPTSSLKSLKSFNQAHDFLLNLNQQPHSTKRILAFLEYHDSPQNKFKAIHVAGTSGKGSTCQMIAAILKSAGYKTGLTISPYILDPLEKIQINNKKISKSNFVKLVNKYRSDIKKFRLTYFEAFIALTLIYFSNNKVDYAVIETGLGGRYDATNVFKNPILSIITNIGLDHTEFLGKTRKKIALEKQQIIKNKNALTGSKLIKNAKFIDVNNFICRDAIYRVSANQVFNYKNKIYRLSLLGKFQINNAVLAIEACKYLKILDKHIKKGLLEAKHFGRFTVISKKPLIIIDGAHNFEKMKAFTYSLKKIVNLNQYNNKYLLMAIKSDKDYKKIIKTIAPLFNNITITKFYKSFDPKILKREILMQNKNINVLINNNADTAYSDTLRNIRKNDMLIITGSLYLLGNIFKDKIYKK